MILHSKIFGDKNKHLLILHGLFGQSDNWGTLAKRFSEHYTTHIIDLRNHGRSFHSEQMNFPVMSLDLKNYLESKQLESVYILGHSLGGKVAMEFALMNEQKVKKLIVADIAPKSYPPHHQAIIKGLQNLDFKVIKSRKQADETLSQYISDFGTRQFLLKNLYWKEKEQLALRFNLKVIADNYNELIGSTQTNSVFNNPTLFFSGSKSNYISNEDEVLISQYFSNFKIENIEKAGHWVHAENPNQVFEKTISFLS